MRLGIRQCIEVDCGSSTGVLCGAEYICSGERGRRRRADSSGSRNCGSEEQFSLATSRGVGGDSDADLSLRAATGETSRESIELALCFLNERVPRE